MCISPKTVFAIPKVQRSAAWAPSIFQHFPVFLSISQYFPVFLPKLYLQAKVERSAAWAPSMRPTSQLLTQRPGNQEDKVKELNKKSEHFQDKKIEN